MTNQKEIITVINLIKKEIRKYNNSLMDKVSKEDKNPFKVLISCLLSLRTRDETTDIVAENLFKKASTAKELSEINIKKLESIIKPVNYYKTKAKRIKDISNIIWKKYNSKVPDTRNELMKLKGVGPKTSAVVLTYGFDNDEYIATDTHMHRIPNRLGWIKTKKPEDTEKELKRIIPRRYWIDLNNNFVTFGKKVCMPVSPFCSKCPVYKYCSRVNIKISR
ncbi:endonuclease III [Candidatus Woesearchaeota archaeon]|nr:endonuclease III [Candidatus Woesearchaeota archaeon]